MSCWRRYGDSRQSARTRRSTCICTGSAGNWASPRRSRATCAPCGGSDSGWWRRTEGAAGLRQRRHHRHRRARLPRPARLGAALRPPRRGHVRRRAAERHGGRRARRRRRAARASSAAIAAAGGDPVVHRARRTAPDSRAPAGDVADGRAAAPSRSMVEVDGGVVRLEPVTGRRRDRRWSRSSSRTARSTTGTARDWWILLGIALGLVIGSVIVVDRLARGAVSLGPQPGAGGDGGRRRRPGRAHPAVRPARAGRGRVRVQPDGRPADHLAHQRAGDWSPTCRTGCAPR